MSSTSSSAEPEALQSIRGHIEYVKSEMCAEFVSITDGLKTGRTVLTPATLKAFEKKWGKETKEADDRIFALSLAPETQEWVPEAEKLLTELKGLIQEYVGVLERLFRDPEAKELPPEKTDDEKEREREERRERMEKFRRGEKPD